MKPFIKNNRYVLYNNNNENVHQYMNNDNTNISSKNDNTNINNNYLNLMSLDYINVPCLSFCSLN